MVEILRQSVIFDEGSNNPCFRLLYWLNDKICYSIKKDLLGHDKANYKGCANRCENERT